ncbi:Wat1-related protein [Thalictrum thalictroides]|uniref:WAT1-related protein n=1 Tax=Thalictrum thalictroides TaxID=46969 RepID=A0A7J6VDZ0_THATH|nr:Wat1-related protein [Thalictrum thalictroides]
MVLVQFCFAGMNIVTKLALDTGMNPLVMVTYRQIFATLALAPFAYFIERKTLPKITSQIVFQMFLCSVLGATMNQCLYFLGLKHSSPTITCALNNLLPAVTFIMAVPFKMETVGIKKIAGQAKVLGTIVCVTGAMIMSFYKGKLIEIGSSAIHWTYAQNISASSSGSEVSFLGPVLVIASVVAWSGWFIVQSKMNAEFTAPYTTTAVMCFMASFECAIVAAFFAHTPNEWSLTSNIRLIGAVYNGLMGSAVTFFLMSWCLEKRGPLYVSAFSPLLLVIVAIFGWAVLDEKVYVGSAVGSSLIVLGLYTVLWGKEKEMDPDMDDDVAEKKTIEDIEMPPVHVNGKFNNQ